MQILQDAWNFQRGQRNGQSNKEREKEHGAGPHKREDRERKTA